MVFKFKQSLFLLGLLAPAAFAQTKDLAIVGAHIELGNGKSIASGTIFIHDGKIASVGESVVLPDGITTIDAKGQYVYPGFINAYCTQGLHLPDVPSAGPAPDTRNSAPPTMWHSNKRGIRSDVLAAKCLDIADQLRDAYGMGITTALLSSGSGSVRGIGSVIDYLGKGSVLLSSAAGDLALRGGGGGGGGGGGYPGTLFGVTALTRQVIIDAQAYAADPTAKKDTSFENLKPMVTGQIPTIFTADTARELVRAKRITDEFNLKLIINGGREAYREIDWIKANKTPVILSLDVTDAPSKTPEKGSDTPQEVLNDRYDIWVEHSKNPKVLSDAGVPLAFSLGNGFADYLKGVRKLVTAGLPKDVALQAMTSGAATILGVSDKVGTIEIGKLANLVFLSGDFLDDKTTVQGLIIEGAQMDIKKGTVK
jgi:hypothetical protein